MSFLESLAKQVSEVSLYDVKSYIDKAKAVVMNYTEMEQKVHTATNDEPWGASSTLMQDIASGTFNFQLFNEIMPVIYSRFTEKEASQWRQIYKALQLLEYLIKHGSERVIDDARSHLSMIKMLRNFHYIDDKGKDQGINVRNRSKELAELLGDLERVRQERRKAKTNRNKYIGVGSDGAGGGDFGGSGSGLSSGGGGRYGGFGSESFNDHSMSSPSYPSSSYPSSSGGGGGGRSGNRDSFEEYDAGDDDDRAAAAAPSARGSSSRGSAAARAPAPIKKDTPVIAQQPAVRQKEVNLFDFDDDKPLGGSSAGAPAQSAPAPAAVNFDDDFDDFQGAPSASIAPAAAAPKPAPAPSSGGASFFDMMGSAAPAAPVSQPRTSQHMPAGPNYSNFGLFGNSSSSSGAGGRPGVSHTSSFPAAGAAGLAPSRAQTQTQPQAQAGGMARPSSAKPAASSSAFDFDDLFAASGAKTSSSAGQQKAGVAAAGNSSMASLAQQKAWGSMGGSSSAAGAPAAGNAGKSGFDDLLF